ncbi:MAG: cob(I)yrinic acid a,c-diamide adenosyltransferase [Acidimicrobiales bacterium]|nr:cob(I)yrinic acid a,c-diamide adenosyltransferase [Phycisphaerales bacterium]MCB0978325.1 cob(I)yrinic acid a,c-diamide adenosyltransferase [Acidimicrobiales bacterium]
MKVYTRKGDDGTTGLYGGGRVRKDSAAPEAYGDVDEAQAALGVARSFAEPGSELDTILIALERDLWVLMSELATDPGNRHKLKAGATLVTAEMVEALEVRIDEISERFEMPREFVVPGQNQIAGFLDLARTVVRRAERRSAAAVVEGSQVGPYLNRLSDLVFTLARWQEGKALTARDHGND